jgi:hypothetical protein
MPRTVYALLAGINDYPGSDQLTGCLADIDDVAAYLGDWIDSSRSFRFEPLFLKDGAATRQGLIEGFRNHLGRAGDQDVALFYFCGHGSQAPAPPQLWPTAPSRLMETLVCHDSRRGGVDLVDKELAWLIAAVARAGAHLVVVLDCCHAGSGTRGSLPVKGSRRLPPNFQQRPAESFLAPLDELAAVTRTVGGAEGSSGWALGGSGRHVLLAACRQEEEAREVILDGKPCGVFSHCLGAALRQASAPLTYRDLLAQAAAGVRSRVSLQSPQLEVTHPADLHAVFLDGSLRARPAYFTVAHDPTLGWFLDAGAARGIRPPAGGETTIFALLPAAADPTQLHDLSGAVGQAEVVKVLPARSIVRAEGVPDLDRGTTYRAVVACLPLPRYGVRLEGEAAGVALLRQALAQASKGPTASLLVREAGADESADFRVLARAGAYLIARPADDRPLTIPLQPYSAATAALVVQRLEHVARWQTIADLPENAGAVRQGDVELRLFQAGVEIPGPDVVLRYQGEERPTVEVRLANRSARPRYCALLALSDAFAVESILEEGTGVIRLDPGAPPYTKLIYASVAEELQRQGVTEARDVLKLIVSAAEFNALELGQGELSQPYTTRQMRSPPKSLLQRLARRTGLRTISGRAEPGEGYDQWCTHKVTFTTVRPLPTQAVPAPGEHVTLTRGLTLAGHAHFRGQAQLTTQTGTARGLGSLPVPPILRQDLDLVRPLVFSPAWGTDPGLNVLELSASRALMDRVTPEDPLRLHLDESLQPEEHILPIGYDGEFFLPVGRALPAQGGGTEVLLERLPAERTRGVIDASRILLYKLVGPRLGLGYSYPILAAAEIKDNPGIQYETDPGKVRAKVERPEVRRILLYLHGLAGDSRELVSLRGLLRRSAEGADASSSNLYDLILTFDYESVHTPIEQTARELGKRLRDVGLGAGHDKVLHVVGHGIGGLVARWFIEREGGSQVVQHLVMLGTPNAGSPWPTVHAWCSFAVGLSLNALTVVFWPVPVLRGLMAALRGLVSATEMIDVTLDETQGGSAFLKSLAASPDPAVPYTVLAGNTSLIPGALELLPGAKTSVAERLLERVLPRPVQHKATELLVFLGKPNDVAVSVASCASLPPDRKHPHELRPVACDHLTYFRTSAGLGELGGVLRRLWAAE